MLEIFHFRSALRTVTFSDVKQSLDEKEEIISRSTSSRTSTTEYYSAISSCQFMTHVICYYYRFVKLFKEQNSII